MSWNLSPFNTVPRGWWMLIWVKWIVNALIWARVWWENVVERSYYYYYYYRDTKFTFQVESPNSRLQSKLQTPAHFKYVPVVVSLLEKCLPSYWVCQSKDMGYVNVALSMSSIYGFGSKDGLLSIICTNNKLINSCFPDPVVNTVLDKKFIAIKIEET